MAPHLAGGAIHAFHGDKRLAALLAALVTMVIGFLWYSLLFARPWMVLMGYEPDDKAKLRVR